MKWRCVLVTAMAMLCLPRHSTASTFSMQRFPMRKMTAPEPKNALHSIKQRFSSKVSRRKTTDQGHDSSELHNGIKIREKLFEIGLCTVAAGLMFRVAYWWYNAGIPALTSWIASDEQRITLFSFFVAMYVYHSIAFIPLCACGAIISALLDTALPKPNLQRSIDLQGGGSSDNIVTTTLPSKKSRRSIRHFLPFVARRQGRVEKDDTKASASETQELLEFGLALFAGLIVYCTMDWWISALGGFIAYVYNAITILSISILVATMLNQEPNEAENAPKRKDLRIKVRGGGFGEHKTESVSNKTLHRKQLDGLCLVVATVGVATIGLVAAWLQVDDFSGMARIVNFCVYVVGCSCLGIIALILTMAQSVDEATSPTNNAPSGVASTDESIRLLSDCNGLRGGGVYYDERGLVENIRAPSFPLSCRGYPNEAESDRISRFRDEDRCCELKTGVLGNISLKKLCARLFEITAVLAFVCALLYLQAIVEVGLQQARDGIVVLEEGRPVIFIAMELFQTNLAACGIAVLSRLSLALVSLLSSSIRRDEAGNKHLVLSWKDSSITMRGGSNANLDADESAKQHKSDAHKAPVLQGVLMFCIGFISAGIVCLFFLSLVKMFFSGLEWNCC